MGRFKLPMDERTITRGQKSTNSKYLFIGDVFQTNKFLFINCRFGDNFPAKRLTPIVTKAPSGEMVTIWYNTQNALGIFNKKANDLIFCKPTSTDNR